MKVLFGIVLLWVVSGVAFYMGRLSLYYFVVWGLWFNPGIVDAVIFLGGGCVALLFAVGFTAQVVEQWLFVRRLKG